MSVSEEFKLKYSTAKKEEVTRQITTTLEELEQAYNSTMASWETIKNKFTLEADIMKKLNEIGSTNGDENIAAQEFKKIKTSMDNLIASLKTIDTSWGTISDQIRTAVNNFDVKSGESTPSGNSAE